jgi:hypothetical protein
LPSFVLLTLLLSCDRPAAERPAPAPTPAVALETTLATVAGLGSHRLEARTTTTVEREGGAAEEDEESFSLRWTDIDHWQVVRRHGERVLQDVRVFEGIAWSSRNARPFEKRGDPAPYLADLTVGWDPWKQAFGSWSDAIGFRAAGTEDIEGRPALVYALEPLSGGASADRSRGVVAVEGRVWIDEATAVRLVGDARVVVRQRGRERSIHLRFSVSQIGGESGAELPPGVETPGPEPSTENP